LIDGDRVVEEMPDQSRLTRRYTERAVDFIRRNAGRPFFLYLAHSMPHVPIFAGKDFRGRSKRGALGDVIEEIDASVGAVLGELRRQGIDDDTLVIFTSDNGPWLSYGNHAGSAGPFREGKGTSFEGGIRVPCIVRWPGRVPAGRVSDEPWMTIDVLPTVAGLVGAPPPARRIDGRDVWPVIEGRHGARNPHPAYFIYYGMGELQAVIAGSWKLFLPHRSQTLANGRGGTNGTPASYRPLPVGLELYDLAGDPGERHNVAGMHPEVVQSLLRHAEEARLDLGDSLTRRVGSGVRPVGKAE
jgi:arylsulfatase A-like enzyme